MKWLVLKGKKYVHSQLNRPTRHVDETKRVDNGCSALQTELRVLILLCRIAGQTRRERGSSGSWHVVVAGYEGSSGEVEAVRLMLLGPVHLDGFEEFRPLVDLNKPMFKISLMLRILIGWMRKWVISPGSDIIKHPVQKLLW